MARSYTPIPAAGRLRLPAAIVHPDDELPKTWRVLEQWTYRGQVGAYLIRVPQTAFAAQHDTSWAQIVYRRSAPRRRTAHIGNAIGHAIEWSTCDRQPGLYRSDLRDADARKAYYTEQGIDLEALDGEQKVRIRAGEYAKKAGEELEERRRRARATAVDSVVKIFPNASPEQFERVLNEVWRKMTRTLDYLR